MSDERRYVDELECDRRIREQSAKVEAYYKTDRDRWKALAGRAVESLLRMQRDHTLNAADPCWCAHRKELHIQFCDDARAVVSDPTGQRALEEWQELRRQVDNIIQHGRSAVVHITGDPEDGDLQTLKVEEAWKAIEEERRLGREANNDANNLRQQLSERERRIEWLEANNVVFNERQGRLIEELAEYRQKLGAAENGLNYWRGQCYEARRRIAELEITARNLLSHYGALEPPRGRLQDCIKLLRAALATEK